MHHRSLSFALALMSCALPCAVAQTTPPPSTPPQAPPPESPSPPPTEQPTATPATTTGPQLDLYAGPPWTIRVDPAVWWVSPAGDLKLPSSGMTGGDSVRLSTLNLDTPEFSPAGSLSINAADFRFSFFGAAYSRDADGVASTDFQIGDDSFAAGDTFESNFEFNLFDITAGYRIYSHDWRQCSVDKEQCVDVVLDVYGLAGGRLYDMNIGVNAPGDTGNDTDQFFGDLIAGARAEVTFLHDLNLNVQFTAGGMGDSDRSSFSIDIQVWGEWRPWENVGLQIGWRHLDFSMEDGDGAGKFELDGSMAGLFAGVVIRF